ncbi:MAG: hypothetical protein H6739_13595 [Alphaproteobacteria bacterium]|nr:hypothetical protein [Alphaproteobacteria bacterium]
MDNYLTPEIFREVVESFDWPAEYLIEDDLPDGMTLKFPHCSLYFPEGYEGEMSLEFLPEDTGFPYNLGLFEAMMVFAPFSERDGRPLVEGLRNDDAPYGSETKVRNGVHDLCMWAQKYLHPVILGDFSWVQRYREMTGR